MKKNKFIRSVAIGCFLSVCTAAFAQNGVKDIKGVIYDENGEPIIGASIVVQGTSNGTISDLEGNFTLSLIPQHILLEINLKY